MSLFTLNVFKIILGLFSYQEIVGEESKKAKHRFVIKLPLRPTVAFSEVILCDWQPFLFSGNLKPLFKRIGRQKAPGFLEYF